MTSHTSASSNRGTRKVPTFFGITVALALFGLQCQPGGLGSVMAYPTLWRTPRFNSSTLGGMTFAHVTKVQRNHSFSSSAELEPLLFICALEFPLCVGDKDLVGPPRPAQQYQAHFPSRALAQRHLYAEGCTGQACHCMHPNVMCYLQPVRAQSN